MHAPVVQNLQLKDWPESQRQNLHERLCEPLPPRPKVQDLLGGQVFGLEDHQGGAHRYEGLHHLQR